MFWEAMIGELRAVQLDLAARAKFAGKDGKVRETRSLLADHFQPAPTEEQREVKQIRTASRMSKAFDEGYIEVG